MADDTTPETNDDDTTEIVTPVEDDSTAPTGQPTAEAPAPAPAAAATGWRRLDRASVLVTIGAVAVLAAVFGAGYATGHMTGDDDHARHMERMGGPGGMRMERRGGGPGMGSDERGGSFRGAPGMDGGPELDARGPGGEGRGGFGGGRGRGLGVVGTIESIDGDTIIVSPAGPDGDDVTVTLTDDTAFRGGLGKGKVDREDLAEGDTVAVRASSNDSEAEDDEALEADTVIVVDSADDE